MAAHRPSSSAAPRAWAWANAGAGAVLCGAAAWLALAAAGLDADPAAPHGGAFQWLGVAVVLPTGVLLLAAAWGHARLGRRRWALQALPLVYLAAVAA